MKPFVPRIMALIAIIAVLTAAKADTADRRDVPDTAAEHSLLKQAVRAADTSGWGAPDSWLRWGAANLWLSDHEALIFRDVASNYQTTFCLHDFSTGQQAVLKDISEAYNKTECYPWTIKVSPDGQWMLWPTETSYFAASLDGKHLVQTRIKEGPPRGQSFNARIRVSFCWMRDSRHWVEFDFDRLSRMYTKAIIRSVEDPQYHKTVAIPLNSPIAMLPGDCFGYPTSAGPGCGKTADSLLFVSDWLSQEGSKKRIVEIDLSGEQARVSRDLKITLPPGMLFENMAFSPDGEQIAWKLVKKEKERPPAPAGVGAGDTSPPKSKTIGLWVSRIDGSNMRLLGMEEAFGKQGKDGRTYIEQPDYLRWLPDGKKISFVYKKGIWTVPVAP